MLIIFLLFSIVVLFSECSLQLRPQSFDLLVLLELQITETVDVALDQYRHSYGCLYTCMFLSRCFVTV